MNHFSTDVGSANYRVKLPFPPSVNTYWRRSGTHMHISKAGAAFRIAALGIVGIQDRTLFPTQHLRVILELHRKDHRRYDVDNFSKGVLDALTHARIWGDDSQIDELHIRRGPVEKPGYCLVSIQVIEDSPCASFYFSQLWPATSSLSSLPPAMLQ